MNFIMPGRELNLWFLLIRKRTVPEKSVKVNGTQDQDLLNVLNNFYELLRKMIFLVR